MNVYTIKYKGKLSTEKKSQVEAVLSRLFDVKKVNIEAEKHEIRLVLDELGCIKSCLTLLDSMGLQAEKPLQIV